MTLSPSQLREHYKCSTKYAFYLYHLSQVLNFDVTAKPGALPTNNGTAAIWKINKKTKQITGTFSPYLCTYLGTPNSTLWYSALDQRRRIKAKYHHCLCSWGQLPLPNRRLGRLGGRGEQVRKSGGTSPFALRVWITSCMILTTRPYISDITQELFLIKW